MKFLKTLIVVCALSSATMAEDYRSNGQTWTLSDQGANIVSHMGREAVKVNRGTLTFEDTSFKNGIIEFDIAMPGIRGFAGVNFRTRDNGMSENFYLRGHLSGMPDANQYQPIFNGNSAWQIFHGARYCAPTRYATDRWTKVRLVVKGNKMDVFIDSDKPVLHVGNLMLGSTPGGVTLNGFVADFYYSNMRVTKDDSVTLTGTPAPVPELPAGLIKSFRVGTTAVAADKIEAQPWLDKALLEGQTWQTLAVGETGAANLGRISARTRDVNTLLAKLTITAEEAKTIRLKYGFSDRVTVFLNGHALAHGNDTYQTRDYRYLGTIGLFDSVFLPLAEGDNDVVFAVTEAFGGWALMAAIEDQTGIEVR
ncbi:MULTISPECIES: hypothetical protein [Kordiimonas]|uniref:hypothetical protein n=1 Tax=Kordiimonas TaxID=288021 RepID=UPI00257CCE6E|nr:hypothetical protein [Kordiimonas sp. UBA4487]